MKEKIKKAAKIAGSALVDFGKCYIKGFCAGAGIVIVGALIYAKAKNVHLEWSPNE